MCSQSFQNFQDLPNHVKASHGLNTDKVLECVPCRIVFMNQAALAEHNCEAHCFKCNFCAKSFVGNGQEDYKRLLNHLIACHKPKPKDCVTCDRTVASASRSIEGFEIFVDHLTEHSTGKPAPSFPCSHCGLHFKTDLELSRHDVSNHRFKCGVCHGPKVFKTLQGLQSHTNQIHGIIQPRNNACPTCSTVIPQIDAFVTHVLGHGLRMTTCELCSHNKSRFYAPEEHRSRHMQVCHAKLFKT